MSKLAVLFPGVGYTHDKPLMYYSRKIAMDNGYETMCISYTGLPDNIKGNAEKKKQALSIAYEQACEQLKDVDFSKYEEVIIIGKSIGSVVAAKYQEEHINSARLILYTPVEATFRFSINDAVAFIGDSDSWSDLETVKALAGKENVPLHIYAGCNHSLEVSGSVSDNLEILKDVMDKTAEYFKRFCVSEKEL